MLHDTTTDFDNLSQRYHIDDTGHKGLIPGGTLGAKVHLFNLYNKVQMSCLVLSSLRCTVEQIGIVWMVRV
eukprot:COSAG02_NODE_455_length_21984_cov_4.049760_6_plen_71_part_00